MPSPQSVSAGRYRRLFLLGVGLLSVMAVAICAAALLAAALPSPGIPGGQLFASDEQIARAARARQTSSAHHTLQPGPEKFDHQRFAPRRPPEPVVERRWVQAGRERVPDSQPSANPAAARAAHLDRSDAARRAAVEKFGGSPLTEGAVEAGLAWLAAHQSPEGWWDRVEFQRRCPAGDICAGPALRRTEHSLRAGITGLVLLAFLGAGYSHQEGTYQANVAAALNALLSMQQEDGGFSPTPEMAGYDNSLATLALAEAFAMTEDERLRVPLQRAVVRLASSQQAAGGWDYVPDRRSGRNDTSITAWAVQALQACAAAGIDVPPETLVRAAVYFSQAAESDGRVRYSDGGVGVTLNKDGTLQYRYGAAMTAAGLLSETILGWRLDSPVAARQRALLLSERPSQALFQGRDRSELHSEYYWYYGTAAMFQLGGEHWQRWNAALRDAILPLQNREKRASGPKRHAFGSFQPYGPSWGRWGRMGGRVYTTAICVLTLEIYYRHTPAYLSDELAMTTADWRRYLANESPRGRRAAAECLAELRVEVAEPILLELIADADSEVALSAALALADVDSPAGAAVLESAATHDTVEKLRIEQARRQVREVSALPPAEGVVRLVDETSNLVTLDLPRSYAGMLLARKGEEAAALRVVQRFSTQQLVVAERLDDAALRGGDAVIQVRPD